MIKFKKKKKKKRKKKKKKKKKKKVIFILFDKFFLIYANFYVQNAKDFYSPLIYNISYTSFLFIYLFIIIKISFDKYKKY